MLITIQKVVETPGTMLGVVSSLCLPPSAECMYNRHMTSIKIFSLLVAMPESVSGGGVGVRRRWVWVSRRDVIGSGRWVQVMECVKIEGVERNGVWKRVSSHTHIDMLHRSSKRDQVVFVLVL